MTVLVDIFYEQAACLLITVQPTTFFAMHGHYTEELVVYVVMHVVLQPSCVYKCGRAMHNASASMHHQIT